MISISHRENKFYKEQKTCHISEKKNFMDKDEEDYKNEIKVKDHCHYTGRLTRAAQSKCYLN